MATEQKELWDSFNGVGFAAEYSKYSNAACNDADGNSIQATYATKAAIAPKMDKAALGTGMYEVPMDNTIEIGGRAYPIVKIGNQLWMAENLEYVWDGLTVGGSSSSDSRAWYYNNDKSFYGLDGTYKCGLLYNWFAVDSLNSGTLLPEGWRVASKSDYDLLISFIGSNAATKLKSKDNAIVSGYPNNWNGNDEYGFNALPCGRYPEVSFLGFGSELFLWTSTYDQGLSSYLVSMKNTESYVSIGTNHKTCGFYVRLVKNIT